MTQTSKVQDLLNKIPPQDIAQRASQCGSFARAIFHFEKYLRTREDIENPDEYDGRDADMAQLQAMYAGIEELDAVDGLSAQLQILSPEQQVLAHKRAGRWSAAQSYYEVELRSHPKDASLQRELLTCLKARGQYSKFFRLSH